MTGGFKSPHEPGSALWCEALSAHIEEAIDRDSIAEHREPEPGRWHLGASEIGKPCSRQIWYSFRWAMKVEHTGRMHRLFQRGHREEPNFVHRLKRVGVDVADVDPSTGKQWQMVHPSEPHYGGSLDGIASVPWVPPPFSLMIAEFKTHNDASFEKLLKKGVSLSKPLHFAQMSSYGQVKGFPLGLYCAVNKNTDALAIRVTPLQYSLGEITFKKAVHIIRSQQAPQRISENSAHHDCKMCDYRGVCHLRQPLLKNCRSCMHAVPNQHDKEWTCGKFSGVIPRDFVVKGCDYWSPIA
jgi:hypothetical protein